MRLQEKLDWLCPLDLAKKISGTEKCWALLYSGMRLDFTGRYSYLAIRPAEQIIANTSPPEIKNGRWFGYFGYGLKNSLEKLPEDKPGIINLPPLWLVNYRTIFIFDHDNKSIELWSDDEFDPNDFFSGKTSNDIPKIPAINSNMSKDQYLAKVIAIKEHIGAGDIYQANLTRKFYGEFAETPSAIAIFEKLSKASPSPYSCLMKLDDNFIISSSPEMFLKIDAEGNIESRPIKGSADKNDSSKALQHSQKDRAENLMIVDLLRNDLSRHSVPGSVQVKSLFDVTSYETLHHMSSTIIGKKADSASSLQIIKDCFPPGSMTGTPKIKAMEICSAYEKMARGVYSGAIGWLDSNGEIELSVVIRTIVLNGKTFEFQVGGAITADSDPEKEWRETIFKARGICAALSIKNLI